MNFDKQKIVKIVLANLEEDLGSKRKYYEDLKEAVVKADGAMRSRSDTYRFQYSIQADNLSKVITNLETLKSFLKELEVVRSDKEVVEVGDVVIVDKAGVEEFYLIVPNLGIMKKFNIDDMAVYMVSEKSPIGEVLVGARVGEKVEFREQIFRIVEVV